MILEDNSPLYVHNPRKIKRKHGGLVVSVPERKEYKVVFKKSLLLNDFDSFHMGMINLLRSMLCAVNLFRLDINITVARHYNSF